jgi:uncharacterized membrane protein YfcA
MSWVALAVLSLTALVAAFIQGAVGMGFALIIGPLLALLVPSLIPAGVMVMMLPLNLLVMLRERSALDWFGAGWITLGRVGGTLVGLAVVAAISGPSLTRFVGITTIAAALVSLAAPHFNPGRGAFAVAGLVTGITETATGIGGPPLALVYQHHPAATLRSTMAGCFLVGEILSLGLLACLGRIAPWDMAWAAALFPFIVAGAAVSRSLHRRLDPGIMRLLVLSFAIASGALCLVR